MCVHVHVCVCMEVIMFVPVLGSDMCLFTCILMFVYICICVYNL